MIKVYCGTYHKYNCGSIEGEWVDLDDFSSKEEFLEKCAEIHSDEDDPEFMFQDYEYDFDFEKGFVSESFVSPDYWTFKENRDSFSYLSDEDIDAIYDYYITNCGNDFSLDFISDFENKHSFSKYDTSSKADAFENFLEETGFFLDVPDKIRNYIDIESVMRDYELDGIDITEKDGYFYIFS